MNITYDEAKNRRNIERRQLPFSLVESFDFNSAVFEQDLRRVYPEIRIQAIGKIDGRLHVLIFTLARGDLRVISLRKANAREVKRYEAKARS